MSTKTLRKRIALVAVSAMGFGLMSTVVAPSASAAAVTASVTPVRVTYTGTALDEVPYAKISWATTAAMITSDTVVLALTSAPTSAAAVKVMINTSIGLTRGSTVGLGGAGAGVDTLAGAGTFVAIGVASSAGTASMAIAADVAGYYAGTLTTTSATGVPNDVVSFSFTTRGAVAAVTPTVSVASVSPSGVSTLTATLTDSGGFTTQPLMVDSVNISDGASTGTFAAGLTAFTVEAGGSVAATSLYDGVAAVVYTATATAGSAATLTVTPAGTLGNIAASSVTVTTDATTLSGVAPTAIVVAEGLETAASATVPRYDVTTGTSTLTVDFTGVASTVYRWSISASAGTVNGASTTTTPVYVNSTTDSAGDGEFSYTLAGAALLPAATSTVTAVDVANVTLGTVNAITTQRNAAVDLALSAASPNKSLVKALGATTAVNFTVKNQYAAAFGAGFTVRAYRTSTTGTLLSTAVTDSTGVAALTVSGASTLTTGGSEVYVYTIQAPGGAESAATSAAAATTTITYTTTGNITSSTTAVDNVTAQATNILDSSAVLYAAQTKYPVITVPGNTGRPAWTVPGTSYQTASTGVITAGTAATMIKLTTTNTPANTTTWTSDSGAFVSSSAAPTAAAALASVTVSDATAAYGYAHTVGLHTFTGTSGGKTTTVKVWVVNDAANYYNIAASSLSTSLTTGSNTVMTMTMTDMYGNVINPAAGLVTATAAGSVRLAGQALTQSLTTSAAGTVSFTVVADASAGTGTITLAPTTTGAAAWLSTFTPVTGMAAPVKSVVLSYTITGATVKTVDQVSTELAAVSATLAAKIAADTAAAATAATAAAAAATAAAADKKALDAAIAAVLDAANNATDAATEAIDNGSAATAAAQDAIDAGDAATAAAQDATDAATAAGEAAAAAGEIAQQAADSAAEAVDAANAATDAANAAAEASDAATNAALDAVDAANAATAAANAASDAVAALAAQMATAIAGIKAQITALTNLIVKIQKKIKA